MNSLILESTLVIQRVLSPDRSISILFLKLAVIVNDHLLLIGLYLPNACTENV